jgi:uncharacterized Zn finger protein
MEAVSAFILKCPECGEGPHRVLRGRASAKTLEATVRCVSCGQVRKERIPVAEPVDVPLIISWKGQSRRAKLTMDSGERVAVGQDLYLDDERLVVTALESSGRRVPSAKAGEVDTMWTKRFHEVTVKVAVRIGGRTVHHEVTADPDEEFSVGDIMEVKRGKAVVFKILTVENRRTRSSAARHIKKVYARAIRERWA